MNVSIQQRYSILLVSDFNCPRLGGVELHQHQIAQALRKRGHKVTIMTGTYEQSKNNAKPHWNKENMSVRQGIRYISGGIRVYHVPVKQIGSQASLPVLNALFPLFRNIVHREKVDIVHGHQATSAMVHETIMHAKTMGIRCVYTDHSLFSFNDTAAIHLNKLMKFTMIGIDAAIAVSHCTRENLCIRAHLHPERIFVIPNAIDAQKFEPAIPQSAPSVQERVNIVVISRMVFRKGAQLISEVLQPICQRYPQVHFIIAGDGNKQLLVEEAREKYSLQERVTLLGSIPHSDVRRVLCMGHIFLNCSLTEAFCIAILEAVSCGLLAVSTRVGGIPEILPPGMIRFAEPDIDDIVRAVSDAVDDCIAGRVSAPHLVHTKVDGMYSWHTVAEHVERVYDQIMLVPRRSHYEQVIEMLMAGPFSGILFALILVWDYMVWIILEWFEPAASIERAIDWPRD